MPVNQVEPLQSCSSSVSQSVQASGKPPRDSKPHLQIGAPAQNDVPRIRGTKSSHGGGKFAPLFLVSEAPEISTEKEAPAVAGGSVQHYSKKIQEILNSKAPSKEKEDFCKELDSFLRREYARVCFRHPITPWAKRDQIFRKQPREPDEASTGQSTNLSSLESSSTFAAEDVMLTIQEMQRKQEL